MSVEYTTEVINITKIKEGFYVGDQVAATNLDVIIQFKLTHMINATGTQIINKWETIGIKYLTLNWSETPTQSLFDSKDEIANRIVAFIDDSFNRGEGLLAHSVRGQNRVCIVVIIYLMKKYKWNLNKCLDFLRNKKQDVDIPKYFLNQIILFENRLTKKGEGIKSIPWTEENLPDPEEKLLRNTYVNSLPTNPSMIPKEMITTKERKHIAWADSNPYKKELLFHINTAKDLFYQRDVKPVTAHKRLRPSSSCMKKRSNSMGELMMKRSNSKGNITDSVLIGGISVGGSTNSIPGGYSGFNVNNIKPITPQSMNNSTNKNDYSGIMNMRLSGSIQIGNNTNNTGVSGTNNPNLAASMMTMLNNNFINLSTLNNKTSSNNTNMNISGINNNLSHTIGQNPGTITVNTNNSLSNLTGINSNNTTNQNTNNYGLQQNSLNSKLNYINSNTSELLANYTPLYGGTNSNSKNQINISVQNKQQIDNTNSRINHFQMQPNTQTRSQSYSQIENNNLANLRGSYNINTANSLNPNNIKNYSIMKENPNLLSQQQDKAKIIIANKFENIVNNNINNIYINPDAFTTTTSKQGLIKLPNEKNEQSNPVIGPIPNIQFSTPLTGMNVNINTNNNNYRPKEHKIAKTSENQRPLTNNFISGIANANINYLIPNSNNNNSINKENNERKFKIIDYSTNTNQNIQNTTNFTRDLNYFSPVNPSNQNKNQFLYNTMNPTYGVSIQNSSSSSSMNKPINNYNPNLNKKNHYQSGNALFNRPSSGGAQKGPIKIKNDSSSLYGKKPSTPDQFGHFKTNMSQKQNYYGTIKKKNDPVNVRPSTAPQKDKNSLGGTIQRNSSNTQMTRQYGVNKRLPSPNLSSGNSLSKTQKISTGKYRAQSPMVKSTNMTMGTIKRGAYHNKMY